jgi:serine phosphatase RsbU (regulator of sigma subunit)
MCAPLVGGDSKAFGVIQLDTQDRSKKFTQEDLKFLLGVSNQASIALENAKFHEDMVARERLKREVELAHQVQLSFLPRKLPEAAGYEFFAHYEPALEVGGDYYDFVPLAGGKLAIAVGDVAGKGIPAALLMAKLSSDTRFCLLTEANPGQAISTLNTLLYPHTSPMDRFVTLTACVLDPKTHVVTLVSAGHPPPMIYRQAAGSLADSMPRSVPGLPLGMMEDFGYESCQVALQPGDALLFFSDGVPDAVNVRNVPFGNQGIHAVLESGGPMSARGFGERLVKAVKQHAAGRSPHDDITLVILSRLV